MPTEPPPSSSPRPRHPWQRLTLAQLQRLRHWRALQRARRSHRLECAVWEAVLTLWMLGWTAWLPALALQLQTLLPLCMVAIFLPQLYAYGRARAHALGQLRCDWLEVID
jgi:hypothetical protein